MVSISEDKLREMEDEMNRFEQEISQGTGSPSVVPVLVASVVPVLATSAPRLFIGSNTYNHVSEQLQLQQPLMPPPHLITQSPIIQHAAMPPPPLMMPPNPPRSLLHVHVNGPPNFGNIGQQAMNVPPPSTHLQFVPHQLRSSDTVPAMRSNPLISGMQHNISQESKDMHHGQPMCPQQPATMGNEMSKTSTPVVISAKPTLYSAKSKRSHAKQSDDEPEAKVSNSVIKPLKDTQPSPVISNATITTVSIPAGPAAFPPSFINFPGAFDDKKKDKKNKKYVRTAGGQVWEDNTLLEWDSDDFRVFCGDLGNDVTDEVLIRTFSRYPSFQKARVVRDKKTNKTKGFGFVSFKDPTDFIKAMKEMNGKYVGSRPIKLRKSSWQERNIEMVKRKNKEKQRLGLR